MGFSSASCCATLGGFLTALAPGDFFGGAGALGCFSVARLDREKDKLLPHSLQVEPSGGFSQSHAPQTMPASTVIPHHHFCALSTTNCIIFIYVTKGVNIFPRSLISRATNVLPLPGPFSGSLISRLTLARSNVHATQTSGYHAFPWSNEKAIVRQTRFVLRPLLMDREAAYVEQRDAKRVRCGLCPHHCGLAPGETGQCGTRVNQDGRLVVTTYGEISAMALDPVEKKPLFHFHPGSLTYSIAAVGCNLNCPFCQNHSLSQCLRLESRPVRRGRATAPVEVVQAALREGASSISFTYSEPVLQFEFARDIFEPARLENLDLVFVTNGQINERPATELAQFIAAANVDLKSMSSAAYRDILNGNLKSTLRTIEILVRGGVWTEVTTLVIPDFNDSDDELQQIARFIADLNCDIPWHISRFHPAFMWSNRRSTPVQSLLKAKEIGVQAGLRYVYVGNLPGTEDEKTFCPNCRQLLIDRTGFTVNRIAIKNSRCQACGEVIAGVHLP